MKLIAQIFLVLALITVPISVFGTTINYQDFSDTTGLSLRHRAAALTTGDDGILHLQDGRFQRGVALLADPIVLGETFNTYFQFQIFNTVQRFGPESGADWLFFKIQTENGLLGAGSGNSVGVEFDIWNNGGRDNYSSNHIGVNVNYDFESIVTQHVTPNFNNELLWHTWIDYDGSNLEIYASNSSIRPVTPYISQIIDIDSILGTSNVYLGFHAASGQEGADFDVLKWTFDTQPIPEPATMLLLGTGLVGLAGFRRKNKKV